MEPIFINVLDHDGRSFRVDYIPSTKSFGEKTKSDLTVEKIQSHILVSASEHSGNDDDFMQSMCKGLVVLSYLKGDETKSGAVEVNTIFLTVNTAEGIQGFILAKPIDDNGIYLDVVCARKYGGILINYFMKWTEEKYTYVKLSSLTHVLSLYSLPAFGFQHRKDCFDGNEPDVVIPEDLQKAMSAFTKEEKNSRRIVEDPRFLFKNQHELAEGEEAFPMSGKLLEFVMNLHTKGYTSKAKVKGSVCGRKRPALSSKQFLQYDCYSDGFEMRKCHKFLPNPNVRNVSGGRRKTYRKKQKKRRSTRKH